MRRLLFVLAGALPFLYGTILVQGAQSGTTLGKPAIWWVVVGTGTGAFLGLLLAELARPSTKRRIGPVVLGGVGGFLLGIVYGLFTIENVFKGGWTFSRWVFRSFWISLALWAVFGGSAGAFLGWVAGHLRQAKDTSRSADTRTS